MTSQSLLSPLHWAVAVTAALSVGVNPARVVLYVLCAFVGRVAVANAHPDRNVAPAMRAVLDARRLAMARCREAGTR